MKEKELELIINCVNIEKKKKKINYLCNFTRGCWSLCSGRSWSRGRRVGRGQQ